MLGLKVNTKNNQVFGPYNMFTVHKVYVCYSCTFRISRAWNPLTIFSLW